MTKTLLTKLCLGSSDPFSLLFLILKPCRQEPVAERILLNHFIENPHPLCLIILHTWSNSSSFTTAQVTSGRLGLPSLTFISSQHHATPRYKSQLVLVIFSILSPPIVLFSTLISVVLNKVFLIFFNKCQDSFFPPLKNTSWRITQDWFKLLIYVTLEY